jgi:hypothetical protein
MPTTPDTLTFAIFGYIVIFGLLSAYILRLVALSRKINQKLDQQR